MKIEKIKPEWRLRKSPTNPVYVAESEDLLRYSPSTTEMRRMIKAAHQLRTLFRVTFTGRRSGAIGGFHPVTEIYETDPRKDWSGWLREHYEKGDANRYGGPILNVEEIHEDEVL